MGDKRGGRGKKFQKIGYVCHLRHYAKIQIQSHPKTLLTY